MTLNSSNAEELPLFPYMYTEVVLRNRRFCTVDKTILGNNNIKLDDKEMGLTFPSFYIFKYNLKSFTNIALMFSNKNKAAILCSK